MATLEQSQSRSRTAPPDRVRSTSLLALAGGLTVVALLSELYTRWLHVTNPTIVALSFLLAVLVVATVSVRWVAVVTSLMAFACFNYFFLPPLGQWTISDPQNLAALFALLAVSLVASHLSSVARSRAKEAAASRLEAELVRRGAELKTALLSSLSHDLKTPLTAVTVAANNLDAEWLTADQRHEQLDIVRTELRRLNRLLQGIVDMARIEAHAVAAEPEWVEPAEIIQAATRQAEPALERHQVEIEGDVDKLLVRLDPRLTSAALAHLLENAGQYSPPGSPIVVTVTLADGELRFTVRDRGPGISPEDLDSLFQRFYRGAAAGHHRFGTGMGLAITRGLLAAENGRVWGENDADGGALFTMAVPVESQTAAILEGS